MPLISNRRKQLALPKTSWQLCLLAIIGGIASALLVVCFLLTIDAIKAFYSSYLVDYSSLTLVSRMLIPVIAVVIIFALWKIIGEKHTKIGVPYVLSQLKINYGFIPFKNTIYQFFGAATAVASGFSVGKEGPSVHLGAACASYISSKLNLPFNTMRTLSACCIAAGISACFNTPITAVIFVMEVVLKEYKIHIFIPIMLAAIMGSLITNHILGPIHDFDFFAPFTLNISYYPYLILLGIALGVLAAGFNRQLIFMMEKMRSVPLMLRFLIAALITALLSYLVPNPFTNNMSQVSAILSENWAFTLLALALLAKILMTISVLGLGIPGGVIGPILCIGALIGVLSSSGITLVTGAENITSDFALLGMSGFMAATLGAPLAALFIMLELSDQLDIILPAMITISTSYLISKELFRTEPIFYMQLNTLSLSYKKSPIENFLQSTGIISVMNENVQICNSKNIDIQVAKRIALLSYPLESIVENTPKIDDTENALLVKKSVKENTNGNTINSFLWYEIIKNNTTNNETIKDSITYDTHIHELVPLSSQATLAEAYTLLNANGNDGAYIYHEKLEQLVGVITFEQITYYLNQGQ